MAITQKRKLTEQEVFQGKADKIMNTVAKRTAYYRENPHRFCKDYLNITLKPFQKILICMMNFNNYFMFLACRGLGKTFLTAIFCVVRCILYPGTRICVASGRRRQAIEVIEKITTILMPLSGNLRSEIKDYSTSQADAYVEFFNGSRIKVVTASDNARGARANILVCDEFRLVPLNVIQAVLRKFLIAPRQPGYLNKSEFKHLSERNKEIYMSSCWYQSHWSYEKAKTYTANLVDDKRKYFICALPYQLAIKENLLSREQVEDEMSESDFNSVTWMMEMECLFFSDTEGGLYNYEDIAKNRKIKYPFFPSTERRLADKRLAIPAKQTGEIRILSADIALMSSKVNKNDATSIFLNQLIPASGGKYVSNITYTTNQEGLRTDEQALSIRKLIEEFDVDYLVIDVKGVGLGVVDMIMTDLYDANTGVTYPALSCCNNKEIAERCRVSDAPQKIFAVNGNPLFNSQCALGLREALKQNQVRLLMSETGYDVEDALQEIPGYNKLPAQDKMALKLPYVNTTLLANELVELEYETKDNVIRVKEKAGKRKDRYSSLSYNIYVAKQKERELMAATSTPTVDELVLKFRAPKIKSKH